MDSVKSREGTRRHGDVLRDMDEVKITPFHIKVMFVSGMGFFTDAYDLFIIGIAVTLLKPLWHLSSFDVSLINSTSLIAAAIGAVIFGRVADVLGRKRIYGVEVLVLAAGAIASAFSPNIMWLVVSRFILGVGIGGDYPVSATIMSEYAGKGSRGLLVSLVFAMQGAGLVIGPLVAAALLAMGVSHDLAWRIMLALGAIPALSVFYLRRQIPETPRFALAGRNHAEFIQAAGNVLKDHDAASGPTEEQQPQEEGSSTWEGFRTLVKNPRLLRWLFGAALAWFLLDIAYYGNTVSSPLVLKALDPSKDLLRDTLLQLLIFGVAAIPGYFIAVVTMDRLGRKTIQVVGFAAMSLAFGAMAIVPGITKLVVPFLVLYGFSYFFSEFGPNTTTFIYPSELFPVYVRTTSHGISAAFGKIGAFCGVFAFPLLLDRGLAAAEAVAAVVSLLGLACTFWLLPETKGRSLEEISADEEEVAA